MAGSRRTSARARAAVVPFPARRTHTYVSTLLPSGRSLLVGFAVLAAAAGIYTAARTTSVFAVRDVEVHGAPPALAREIRQTLRPFVGESLLALDGERLLTRLEAIPQVRAASYDRSFPNTLVVYVRRERPIAVLRRGAESWLLSTRARVLGPVSRGDYPPLPRVWVSKSVDVAAGARVGEEEAQRAVRALIPAFEQQPRLRIRTVRTGPGDLTFLLASGLELRLGGETELRLKLQIAREILGELAPPAAGGPGYLDLSVAERPVAGSLNSEVEVEG